MINPEMKFVPRTEFERQPFNRGLAEGVAKGKAEGKAEGRVAGKAEALLRVLAARNLSLTDSQRQTVLACQDQAQLERWLDASVTAPSIDSLLGIAQ